MLNKDMGTIIAFLRLISMIGLPVSIGFYAGSVAAGFIAFFSILFLLGWFGQIRG